MAHSIYGEKQEFGVQRAELLHAKQSKLADLKRTRQQSLARQYALERELLAMRSFPNALFTLLSMEKRSRRVAFEEELRTVAREADQANRRIRKLKTRIRELRQEIRDNSPRVLGKDDFKPLRLEPGKLQALREDCRFCGHSLTEAYPVNLEADYLKHSPDPDAVFHALRRRIAEAAGYAAVNREALRRHIERAGAGDDLARFIKAAREHLAANRSCVDDQRRLESAMEALVMQDLLIWESPDLVAGASVLLSQNLFAALNEFAQRSGHELLLRSIDLPHELAWTCIRLVQVETRYAIKEKILGKMLDCDVIEYRSHDASAGGAYYDGNQRAILVDCADVACLAEGSRFAKLLAEEYGFLPEPELESQLRRSEFVRGAMDAILQESCPPHQSLATALPARLCRILASLIMSPLTKYEVSRLDELAHGSVLDELAGLWLRAGYTAHLGYAMTFGDLAAHDFPELVGASKALLSHVLDTWPVDGRGALHKELRHLAE